MATIAIRGVTHTYELTATTNCPIVVVFIHGWLLSRQYWLPVVQELAPDYQCLTYDLRGFGNSRPPQNYQGSYAPVSYAEDLQILLEALEIQSAWLVGHSLGGTIALWTAHRLPEIIKGIVCVNAGGGIYLHEEFQRFRNAGKQFLKFRPGWLARWSVMDWLFSRTFVAQPVSLQWGQQRVRDFIGAHPQAALGSLLESTTQEEVHRLPQIVASLSQPVYFIAGQQDTVMEPKYVRHLASFHSLFQPEQQNVIELANCGHLAMIEQPQHLATHLRTMIQSHS